MRLKAARRSLVPTPKTRFFRPSHLSHRHTTGTFPSRETPHDLSRRARCRRRPRPTDSLHCCKHPRSQRSIHPHHSPPCSHSGGNSECTNSAAILPLPQSPPQILMLPFGGPGNVGELDIEIYFGLFCSNAPFLNYAT